MKSDIDVITQSVELIAILVFIIALAVLFYFVASDHNKRIKELEKEIRLQEIRELIKQDEMHSRPGVTSKPRMVEILSK